MYKPDNICEKIFNIIILGDSTVGKSAILKKYFDNTFNPKTQPTIGIDYKSKTIVSWDRSNSIYDLKYTKNTYTRRVFKIQVWDTAGQERFLNITTNYYRIADGILLVYDLTSHNSLKSLNFWLEKIEEFCKPEIPIILVGNKADITTICPDSALINNIIKENGYSHYTCTATNRHIVDSIFSDIIQQMSKNKDPQSSSNETYTISNYNLNINNSYCCPM